jgi:hypothetical protein
MNRSFFHAVYTCKTRCSICGNSVSLECSKTDEQGSAVHEHCYVGRTIALLAVQQQAIKLSESRLLPGAPFLPRSLRQKWGFEDRNCCGPILSAADEPEL